MRRPTEGEWLTVPEGNRHFLLLQGPCGPFFRHLQAALISNGHRCTRVALNGGDAMSSGGGPCVYYRRSLDDWSAWLEEFHKREGLTDVVFYGDCRAYHRKAIDTLKPLGVTIRVLEEGYLRPHWVTCETDGVNGHSELASLDLGRLDFEALAEVGKREDDEFRSAQWHYMLAGFIYYVWALLLTPVFPRYTSHRDLSLAGEAALWFARLFSWPIRNWRSRRSLAAVAASGRPLHLVMLQLNGDSQLRVHSDFESVRDFAEHCVAEFATSGVKDALLVFKNHPLDNGVINFRSVIRAAAQRHGISERVHFIDTGKVVPLLDHAASATAVNSTACHQTLRRGIPTMVLGRAVFNHPEIVPRMRLADFFRARPVVDREVYDQFNRLMQATCQVYGGYYSGPARARALPGVLAMLIHGSPAASRFLLPRQHVSKPRRIS